MAETKVSRSGEIDDVSFSAYVSAATGAAIAQTVFVDVVFDTEEFDTKGWYDNATGRFTPKLPGKYRIDTCVGVQNVNDQGTLHVAIRKNGTNYKWTRIRMSGTGECGGYVGTVVDANGSTDYFNVAVYQSGTPTNLAGSQNNCWITGHKI